MANKPKKTRMCISCRSAGLRGEMLRVVRTPSGEVVIDEDGTLAGRGAYLCKKKACVEKAILQRRISHALSVGAIDRIYEKLGEKYA